MKKYTNVHHNTQCDFHFIIMTYELQLWYFIQYVVTRDETILRNRNDLVTVHVCLVNVQWSSDWISRLKLQSIHVFSLSVVMRGPGAACRWHDHEGLEEDCLERPSVFSFLFFFGIYLPWYHHHHISTSLSLFFFCLFFFISTFCSGWKVFFLHPDVALFSHRPAEWPLGHSCPLAGPADPGPGAVWDPGGLSSEVLQSTTLLQKTLPDQVLDMKIVWKPATFLH